MTKRSFCGSNSKNSLRKQSKTSRLQIMKEDVLRYMENWSSKFRINLYNKQIFNKCLLCAWYWFRYLLAVIEGENTDKKEESIIRGLIDENIPKLRKTWLFRLKGPTRYVTRILKVSTYFLSLGKISELHAFICFYFTFSALRYHWQKL